MKLKHWTIYCHIHIDSGRRYIGLTSQTMMQRWNQHVSKAKFSKDGRWHFPNAIRKYGSQTFSHEVLEICNTLELANLAEAKWINHFNTRDPQFGFNLAKGGEHKPHPIRKNPWDNPEFRAKSLIATRKKWNDSSIRAKLSASHTGVKLSPEHCAGIAKARLNKPPSPESIAKGVATRKKLGTHSRPEVVEKMSKSALLAWLNPEYRENIRIKDSIAIKQLWQNPDHRSKYISYTSTHKLCKKHGPVLLTDCYIHKHGNKSYFECKLCVAYMRKRRSRVKTV